VQEKAQIMALGRVLLFLFVVNLGIAFGAGLYESFIVLPHWLTIGPDGALHWNAQAALADNTGEQFWVFVTTIPLTLLALLNLWAGWRKTEGPLRVWWLTAAVLSLLDRAMTLGYFIPVMVGLMASGDTPEAAANAQRWMNLNYVRHALVLGAWLAALRTFALVQTAKRKMPAYYESRE
jgi:hypothetical protein